MSDEWINTELPEIAKELENTIKNSFHIETEKGLQIPRRHDINNILDNILAALFPGAYSRKSYDSEDINFSINDLLRHICHDLTKHIKSVLSFHCDNTRCYTCECTENANEVSTKLISMLPEIRGILMQDIQSGLDGDPSSKSFHEIILSYPYIEAVATYRVAHALYALDVPVIPRIMTERAHSNTGIDIHPGAKIGPGFFIDHGTGLVIGETCNIGNNVTIYHGVTLGAFSPYDRNGNPEKGKKRHPDIEDNVIIYSGAVILGGETVIGANSVIGGNTWITKSVPPNSVVYSKIDTVLKRTQKKKG